MNYERICYTLNAVLWFTNGIVWAFFHGATLVALSSIAIMSLSVYRARLAG